jgi:hypothetical protein
MQQKTVSTPKQLALAETLKGEPDAGYRPILTEAQRIAANRASIRTSALEDINKATRFAVGGVAEPQQKKDKEYGKISITEDSNMISAGYLKNDNRSGYATAYKMRDYLYYVGLSSATGGYGPRLYDVLMEAATEKGAMLTSDRSMVSGDAQNVWEYYFNNRSDVKKTPLKPSDWTRNNALIDPKLYGKEETWPPANDPAWILQTGYSKSPSLIKSKDVVRSSAKVDYRAVMNSFFSEKRGSSKPVVASNSNGEEFTVGYNEMSTGGRAKFAQGGLVPGVGDQDTVPATLNVGDFVIRKKAVETIGADRLAGMSRYASGGSVDKVPALLTPGEFVFSRQSAQKIGYSKLNQLNHADKIAGYNKGGAVGVVQKFAAGGDAKADKPITISSIANSIIEWLKTEQGPAIPKLVNRPDTPSRASLQISDGIQASIKEVIKALNDLGVSSSRTAELINKGGTLSYKITEQALKKDIERMTMAGASIDQIAAAEKILAEVRSESKVKVGQTQKLENSFRDSTIGQKFGSGGAQQEIILEADKIEKKLKEQYIKYIASKLQMPAGPGGTPADKIKRATEIANDPAEKAKIKERAYLKATENVTGVNRSEFRKEGLSGSDIQKYVNESLKDRKTLADMDKQLIESKIEELKNSYTYRAATDAEQSKMLASVKAAAAEEVSIRREIINDLAKETGSKGVGAAGLDDFRNSPILKTLKGIAPSTYITGAATAAGFVSSNADSIAKNFYDTSTDKGKIGAARTSGALSSASTIASAGLGIAAKSLAYDPSGTLAIITAVGTGLVALGDSIFDFTGSQEKATKEIEKALRAKEISAATSNLNDAFKKLEIDMGNLDFQNAFNKSLSELVLVQAKEMSANIDSAKADYAYQNRSYGDLLNFNFQGSAQMDATQLKEVNREEAERFGPLAEKGYKQIANSISGGASIEQIMRESKFKSARSAIALATPDGISEYTAQVKGEEKATGKPITDERRQAIIDEIAARKILSNEIVRSSIAARETAEALELADLAGRKLASSFEKLFSSTNQAIDKNNFNIDRRKSATEYGTGALSGNAATPEYRSQNINILKNPRAYSSNQFQGALDSTAQGYSPEDAAMIKGAARIQRDLAPVIESSIRGAITGGPGKPGKASLGLEEAAKIAKETGAEQINSLEGVPEELKRTIIQQLDATINAQTNNDQVKEGFKYDNAGAVDKFLETIKEATDKALNNAGKGASEALIAKETARQEAFNEFTKNLARSSSFLKQYNDGLNKARKVFSDFQVSLNETLTGIPQSFTDTKQSSMFETARLTGGITDPTAIGQNIINLQKQGSVLQTNIQQANDNGQTDKAAQFAIQLDKINNQINNSKEALDNLANSSDLVSKAFSEIQKTQGYMQNRTNLTDKLLTQTPEEAKKSNDVFARIQNNLNGGLNTAANSREAREAFSQALRSGRGVQGAYRAGNTVLAQQRAETLEMFRNPDLRGSMMLRMTTPKAAGGLGMSEELANRKLIEQELQLKTQMAKETGQINNPVVAAELETLRKKSRGEIPAELQLKESQAQEAIKIQKDAITASANLANAQAALISPMVELKMSLEGLTQEIKNIRDKDGAVEGGAAAAAAAGKGIDVAVAPGGGVGPVARAKGGTVYAEKGTLINFEPQGTDTVPAMLTPGEFVVNARSTAQHLPLLRAINSGTNIVGNTAMMSDGGVVYLAGGTDGPISKNRLNNVLQGAKNTYGTSESANKGEAVGTIGSIAGAVKEGAEFLGNNKTPGINKVAQAANVISSTSSIIGGVTTAADPTQDSSVRTKAATDAAMATGELVGGAASMLSSKASPVVAVVANATGGVLDPNTAQEVPSPVKAGLGVIGGGTSSPGGSALSTKDTSEAQDETNAALGSTASTAILGATVGTAIAGPAGTAAGTVVGAIAGAASESFKVGSEAAAISYRTNYGAGAEKTQRMEGALAASRTNAYMADNPGTQNAGIMGVFGAAEAANNPGREKEEKESSTAAGTWSSGGLVYLARGGLARQQRKAQLEADKQNKKEMARQRKASYEARKSAQRTRNKKLREGYSVAEANAFASQEFPGFYSSEYSRMTREEEIKKQEIEERRELLLEEKRRKTNETDRGKDLLDRYDGNLTEVEQKKLTYEVQREGEIDKRVPVLDKNGNQVRDPLTGQVEYRTDDSKSEQLNRLYSNRPKGYDFRDTLSPKDQEILDKALSQRREAQAQKIEQQKQRERQKRQREEQRRFLTDNPVQMLSDSPQATQGKVDKMANSMTYNSISSGLGEPQITAPGIVDNTPTIMDRAVEIANRPAPKKEFSRPAPTAAGLERERKRSLDLEYESKAERTKEKVLATVSREGVWDPNAYDATYRRLMRSGIPTRERWTSAQFRDAVEKELSSRSPSYARRRWTGVVPPTYYTQTPEYKAQQDKKQKQRDIRGPYAPGLPGEIDKAADEAMTGVVYPIVNAVAVDGFSIFGIPLTPGVSSLRSNSREETKARLDSLRADTGADARLAEQQQRVAVGADRDMFGANVGDKAYAKFLKLSPEEQKEYLDLRKRARTKEGLRQSEAANLQEYTRLDYFQKTLGVPYQQQQPVPTAYQSDVVVPTTAKTNAGLADQMKDMRDLRAATPLLGSRQYTDRLPGPFEEGATFGTVLTKEIAPYAQRTEEVVDGTGQVMLGTAKVAAGLVAGELAGRVGMTGFAKPQAKAFRESSFETAKQGRRQVEKGAAGGIGKNVVDPVSAIIFGESSPQATFYADQQKILQKQFDATFQRQKTQAEDLAPGLGTSYERAETLARTAYTTATMIALQDVAVGALTNPSTVPARTFTPEENLRYSGKNQVIDNILNDRIRPNTGLDRPMLNVQTEGGSTRLIGTSPTGFNPPPKPSTWNGSAQPPTGPVTEQLTVKDLMSNGRPFGDPIGPTSPLPSPETDSQYLVRQLKGLETPSVPKPTSPYAASSNDFDVADVAQTTTLPSAAVPRPQVATPSRSWSEWADIYAPNINGIINQGRRGVAALRNMVTPERVLKLGGIGIGGGILRELRTSNEEQRERKEQEEKAKKAQRKATGGIIYANNGALISARAQGSDTVPAMLTPGEFVVNRTSAQEHMPLLQAINNRNYESGGLVKYMAQGGVVTPQYKASGGVAVQQYTSSSNNSTSRSSSEDSRLERIEKSMDKFIGVATTFEKASESMGNNVNQFSQAVTTMPTQMSHVLSATVNGSISNSTGANTQIVNSRHEAQIAVDNNNQRMDRASEGALSRSDPTIMRGTPGAGSAHA